MKKLALSFVTVIMLFFCASVGNAKAETKNRKPRMVMVTIDHWKTSFFALPKELPVLISGKEVFDPKAGRYDFAKGITAMRVFIRMRPNDKLIPQYKRFIKKWPLYQSFFKSVDAEDYEAATNVLDKITSIDSKDPAVHFYKGSLHTHLKQYGLAEKEYKKCLDYYPDYGPAYIHLARLARARGKKEEARNYLTEAVKRVRGDEQEGAGVIAQKMLKSLN